MSPSGSSAGRALLVARDDQAAVEIRTWLELAGYEVRGFRDAEAALQELGVVLPDVIVLATELPGLSGIDALARVRRSHPRVPVVMILPEVAPRVVSVIMQMGAYDYLVEPLERNKALTTIRNAVERGRMALRLLQLEREATGQGYDGLIGTSPAMRELYRQLDQLASSEVSILLCGESGTGKEIVARAIHANSGRSAGPFVALNCAAIPDTLQESELFGHERGAFTGATARRVGKFEQAHGGTLFLDEVAELSPALQAKLLRVLQERRFYRVGGDVEARSDFRLIAASHRDLLGLVRNGHFREDLYFRVAVYELEIPPLRARGADILLLAEHFVRVYGHPRELRFAPDVVELLAGYAWPGNVRELQNAMQRAAVSATDGVVQMRDLPRLLRGTDAPAESRPGGVVGPDVTGFPAPLFPGSSSLPGIPAAPTAPRAPSFDLSVETPFPFRVAPAPQENSDVVRLEELERQAIERAIVQHNGNMSDACRALGISRATLYRKIEKYGLR